jgi:hypothetical protein
MGNAFILLLGIAAGSASALLMAHWLIRRKLRKIWTLGTLMLSGLCFGWLGIKAARKVYRAGTQAMADVPERFARRSGKEIYNALFGSAVAGCMQVENYQDQIVPRLDCCIWLEFKTCPAELKRILAANSYKAMPYDSVNDASDYSPKPTWWNPETLGLKAVAMRKHFVADPNRDQIIVFAQDSTHAYYCDMAD